MTSMTVHDAKRLRLVRGERAGTKWVSIYVLTEDGENVEFTAFYDDECPLEVEDE